MEIFFMMRKAFLVHCQMDNISKLVPPGNDYLSPLPNDVEHQE